MDALSALFTLLVAAGSVAAALYAKGYVDRYLDRKPAAHISLHYFAFTLLSLSMTAVVTASGGYTFLFWWELMTLSSFVLIGLPVEKIRLVMNDTSKTPNSGPAGGSRSQVMTGNAIRVACEQLVEAMRKPDGGFYTYDEMKAEGRAVHQDGHFAAGAERAPPGAAVAAGAVGGPV